VAERRLRLGKGPARGDQVGPNPTDRAKNGTKRGVPTEAGGGPVAVALAPANRHDSLVLQDILEAVVVEPPNPLEHEQHLCLDKAFDGAPSDATARVFGYEPHVRRIGEEKLDGAGESRHPARRWVVERTISWLNRCRAILTRWDKKAENYLGMLQLACALLWYRRLHQLGT
jgi:putative transposase